MFWMRKGSENAGHPGISFHNPSRSYDPARQGVLFWGYDRAFEISFLLKLDALVEIDSNTVANEPAILSAFDAHLDQIHDVASGVYTRSSEGSYVYSFILNSSDFPRRSKNQS